METYRICNPQFHYESTHNPRRVLTKPSKPTHNDGYDNEDYDYILYVNDWLGAEDGHKYVISFFMSITTNTFWEDISFLTFWVRGRLAKLSNVRI